MWTAAPDLAAVIFGKAYPTARLLDALRRRGGVPMIPSRSDQPEVPDSDRRAYGGRDPVERLVGGLKRFRRVATRCDEFGPRHLAFVQLASIIVRPCSFGDAT